jgi:hypothetical protein
MGNEKGLSRLVTPFPENDRKNGVTQGKSWSFQRFRFQIFPGVSGVGI